jgi:hypothetical protein
MGHADASTTQIYAHYAPDATSGAVFAERAFGTERERPGPAITAATGKGMS